MLMTLGCLLGRLSCGRLFKDIVIVVLKSSFHCGSCVRLGFTTASGKLVDGGILSRFRIRI